MRKYIKILTFLSCIVLGELYSQCPANNIVYYQNDTFYNTKSCYNAKEFYSNNVFNNLSYFENRKGAFFYINSKFYVYNNGNFQNQGFVILNDKFTLGAFNTNASFNNYKYLTININGEFVVNSTKAFYRHYNDTILNYGTIKNVSGYFGLGRGIVRNFGFFDNNNILYGYINDRGAIFHNISGTLNNNSAIESLSFINDSVINNNGVLNINFFNNYSPICINNGLINSTLGKINVNNATFINNGRLYCDSITNNGTWKGNSQFHSGVFINKKDFYIGENIGVSNFNNKFINALNGTMYFEFSDSSKYGAGISFDALNMNGNDIYLDGT